MRLQRREIVDDVARIPMIAPVMGTDGERWGYTGRVDRATRNALFAHNGATANWLFVDGHGRNVGNFAAVDAEVRADRIRMWPDVDKMLR